MKNILDRLSIKQFDIIHCLMNGGYFERNKQSYGLVLPLSGYTRMPKEIIDNFLARTIISEIVINQDLSRFNISEHAKLEVQKKFVIRYKGEMDKIMVNVKNSNKEHLEKSVLERKSSNVKNFLNI